MTAQIKRNSYGEIISGDCLAAAEKLLEMADKKISVVYNSITGGNSKERGPRNRYSRVRGIFDVNKTGTKALVCMRELEGSRYGFKTTSKEYFLIARHGSGVRVLHANKAIAAKAAKAAGESAGSAIDVVLGKAKLRVKPAAKTNLQEFKARLAAGTVESVNDCPYPYLNSYRAEFFRNTEESGGWLFATEPLSAIERKEFAIPINDYWIDAADQIEYNPYNDAYYAKQLLNLSDEIRGR